MQLNESTYETIFLLYIDKELSPKERLEVDAFIEANPSYALEMEALQATVMSSDMIQYPFKENLKQQTETSLEALEKDWNQTYATILKADVEAIPGLSTPYKNSLKKVTVKKDIILKPFGFKQNKFTYTAIAACLMVFLGYKQLTKTPVSNSIAVKSTTLVFPNTNSTKTSDKIALSNASPKTFIKAVTLAKTNQPVMSKLQASNSSKTQRIHVIQLESVAMAETAPTKNSINQTVITKLPSNYNNPITINAILLPISSANIDAETTIEEKDLTSYEIIDTEDPNRTILIANFEIDGNKLRGLKRRVTSLFKNNKSERNK
jgi:hypothetical protein